MGDHVIKTLDTNLDIPMRAVQDQMHKQFDVGISKIKAFRAKRIATESKASWCWFLNLLRVDLGIEVNFNYTFIFDRKRYYVRHIHENMKSQFKGGVYKEIIWNASKATSVGEFNKMIAELKPFNSDAYDWLMKIPAEQWSRAHFSGRAKYVLLLNNIYEVFNRQLVDGRDQPIITCLEYIREYLMKRIVVVQKVMAKTVGPLTPSVTKLFDAIKKSY
ncbi:hypothetical protein Tco_0435015, partial [Tanacetum coccineum]